ncbi:TA system VapC family ribonuclease toxin [Mycolicibacterium xanthum]|uniref:TA system VapC family ribonuclease toxin n=1 Tax=Mycolicibacterium xanthum TaxID=2796469 RepID=UPI0021059D91|nr:TA system VapC family ribonuclease toxin [Mycolicibacterium xanthum]
MLYAYRHDLPRHADYANWLQALMTGDEPVGISELALSAVVRLATNHRIFDQPGTPTEVLAYCQAVRTAPAAVPLRPGDRHCGIFDQLCREASPTANLVPDAYHAALAIENRATWLTNDRGLARFPKLMWRRPFR